MFVGGIRAFWAILMLWSGAGIALADNLPIYALEITGLYQADGRGAYDQILVQAAPDTQIIRTSAAQAFSHFEKCTDCCLSPANTQPEFYPYQQGFIQTNPINLADIYIWSPPGMPVIDNIDALIGKRVGARIGFPYGKTIEQKLNLQRVANIETNIYLLESGRLDAMIEYVPDAYVIFDNLGKTPFPHHQGAPILSHQDAILCHDTPQGRDFVAAFNKGLTRIKPK